ncbi:hypothetical protein jhhlp_005993 [Lomentospora prolificans]|uniref:5'-deoxynucleotidase n=1 Tax=Lomentospora prolificans TaxID=41688 RepID=A0A2N3N4N4_9PEZI|nr:hypothetical protein jhhlp_005993 [Lomentospora prolificans]
MTDQKPDTDVSDAVKNLGFAATAKIEGAWTVDRVLEQLSDGPALPVGSSSPLPFFHLLERLKTTQREGWRRFGISSCESIADHMYRMSILTFMTPPALAARIDVNRCMKMCLIHDMAESLVGDITPVDGVPKTEKNRREAATVDFMSSGLLGNVYGGAPGRELREIWQEYEDSMTLESQYVHDIDKMELLLQMYEYEKRGKHELDLGEFAYVATKITLPEVADWADQLLKEREQFWSERKHVQGNKGVTGGVGEERKKQQDEYYTKE